MRCAAVSPLAPEALGCSLLAVPGRTMLPEALAEEQVSNTKGSIKSRLLVG